MKIGIIKAGRPPSDLRSAFPTYPQMIEAGMHGQSRVSVWDAERGDLPQAGAADAYIITGSDSAVYDPHPWIGALRQWVAQVDRPLAGICFGHQIMAEAFGGKAARSEQGWLGGFRRHQKTADARWLNADEIFFLPAAHRDQVVEMPEGATLLATSEHCRYAALAYPGRRAISFQAHPEFTPDYVAAVIGLYQDQGEIDAAAAARNRDSLSKPGDHRSAVMQCIEHFLGQQASCGTS